MGSFLSLRSLIFILCHALVLQVSYTNLSFGTPNVETNAMENVVLISVVVIARLIIKLSYVLVTLLLGWSAESSSHYSMS